MKKLALFFCLFFTSLIRGQEDTSILVCENSLEMIAWDLEFIREAKQSIEFSACYGGGKIIREMLGEIEARLEICPELDVFVLMNPISLEDTDLRILAHLKQTYPKRFHLAYTSGVMIVCQDLFTIDNHIKMLVVDEKYFSIGGTNFDDALCSDGTYTPPICENHKRNAIASRLPSGSRDQDIVGKGAVAQKMRKAFHELFALWQHYEKTKIFQKNTEKFKDKNLYKPLNPSQKTTVSRFERADRSIQLEDEKIDVIFGGPHQKKNAITQKYLECVQNARDEIVIGNLFFCPVDPLFRALMESVNREVDLTIITNGYSDITPVYTEGFCWVNRLSYTPIFYGKTFRVWEASAARQAPVKNTRIFEYHVSDILYHKKVMIVDRRYLIIGSYNLGNRSDSSDYESILVIDSPQAAREALKIIDKDILHSVAVTPEEARKWYFDPKISYLGELQRHLNGFL